MIHLKFALWSDDLQTTFTLVRSRVPEPHRALFFFLFTRLRLLATEGKSPAGRRRFTFTANKRAATRRGAGEGEEVIHLERIRVWSAERRRGSKRLSLRVNGVPLLASKP